MCVHNLNLAESLQSPCSVLAAVCQTSFAAARARGFAVPFAAMNACVRGLMRRPDSSKTRKAIGGGTCTRGKSADGGFRRDVRLHPRSQERAAEDQACHGEVNHEPGDVDQRCHERRRCTGGIEAEPAQDEGEHGSHQRPPSHDTNEA